MKKKKKIKNWKVILLIAGIILLVAAFAAYAARVLSNCYPSASVWAQYTPEYLSAVKRSCQFSSPVVVQFATFLWFFVPGISLFSAYWLLNRPQVKSRRSGPLGAFLLLIMFDSLLVMVYGLLRYPVPGVEKPPPAWAVESIALLGFLSYLGALALWHWKRWGIWLFQGASVALAVFILLGGRSLILSAVIVASVILLTLLLRPVRNKLV